MIKLTDLLLESLLLEFSNGDPYDYKLQGPKDCKYDTEYTFETEDIENVGILNYIVSLRNYSWTKRLSISFSTVKKGYDDIGNIPTSILKNIMATITDIVKKHILYCNDSDSDYNVKELTFTPLSSSKDYARNSEHNRRAILYIRVITQQLGIPASQIKKEGGSYIVPINIEDLRK
jgi:hypothetical protein